MYMSLGMLKQKGKEALIYSGGGCVWRKIGGPQKESQRGGLLKSTPDFTLKEEAHKSRYK